METVNIGNSSIDAVPHQFSNFPTTSFGEDGRISVRSSNTQVPFPISVIRRNDETEFEIIILYNPIMKNLSSFLPEDMKYNCNVSTLLSATKEQ